MSDRRFKDLSLPEMRGRWDEHIRQELSDAGIPEVPDAGFDWHPREECPYSLRGELLAWTFRRKWRHWCASALPAQALPTSIGARELRYWREEVRPRLPSTLHDTTFEYQIAGPSGLRRVARVIRRYGRPEASQEYVRDSEGHTLFTDLTAPSERNRWDVHIRRELEEAGIPVVTVKSQEWRPSGELPFLLVGRMLAWHLWRSGCHWLAHSKDSLSDELLPAGTRRTPGGFLRLATQEELRELAVAIRRYGAPKPSQWVSADE